MHDLHKVCVKFAIVHSTLPASECTCPVSGVASCKIPSRITMASTASVSAAPASGAPQSSADASGGGAASVQGPAAPEVYLLDYGGGNVRSVINAVAAAGYPSLKVIKTVDDFAKVRIESFARLLH